MTRSVNTDSARSERNGRVMASFWIKPDAWQFFKKRCAEHGHTATEVLRGMVSAYNQGKWRMPPKEKP